MPAARKASSARSLASPFQLRPAALGSQLAGRPFAACFVDRAERLHGPLQPAANVDPRGRSAGRKLPCDGGAPHQKSPCARSAQGLSAIKELLLQGVACGGNTTGTAFSKGSRGSYPAVSRPPDSGTSESLLNAVGRKPAQKALDRQLLGHQLAIGGSPFLSLRPQDGHAGQDLVPLLQKVLIQAVIGRQPLQIRQLTH